MPVDRDEFGQYAKPIDEFTEWEWRLFSTLEDMCTPKEDEDKTIVAFMADIIDLIELRDQ